jgi:hypothetical protein
MESRNYICGGSTFTYSKGYIGLPLEVGELPESIVVKGETLLRKTLFHVSLLCVKDLLAKKSDIEQEVLTAFCSFVLEKDIAFLRYTGEFRFAQDGERKTLIALCEVAGLEAFFAGLSEKLGIDIPPQPTHVTLYTLQPDIGIGLNSLEDMLTKSVLIDAPFLVKKGLGIA